MPDRLKKIEFTEELLPAVQDFDCGDEEWERPLADWIKAGPGDKNGALGWVLGDKKKNAQVWLHVNGAGDLVGYSSLGRSAWEWPNQTDPRVPISVIPYVAIARRFWGQPKDDPPRYSQQILDHLIFEAALWKDRQPLLGLYVDPRNQRAIAAYQRAGFLAHFRRFIEGPVIYEAMLLKLPAQS
jgi:hypothetical protein